MPFFPRAACGSCRRRSQGLAVIVARDGGSCTNQRWDGAYSPRQTSGSGSWRGLRRRHQLDALVLGVQIARGGAAAPRGGGPVHYSVVTPENQAATATDAIALSAKRVRRLDILVQLRKLYRNLIRAEGLLALQSPVYRPADATHDELDDAVGGPLTEEDAEDLAKQRIDDAVQTVAEMQLTASQLKSSLRKLARRAGFGEVFAAEDTAAGEAAVRARVEAMAEKLATRVHQEIGSLPFTSRAVAQAALDQRNSRYRGAGMRSMMEDDGGGDDGATWDRQRNAAMERLEQAEKVAERIVSKRIPRAVQKVRENPADLLAGVKRSASYAKGLWVRLNGGGRSGNRQEPLPAELPVPVSTKEERARRVSDLMLEVDALEGKLQEASKQRESRLRKAGPPGRARLAGELREMDQDILKLTRSLAVVSLQLEMEAVYGSLEDEALEIAPDVKGSSLRRAGTSNETALLAAEFALLDEGLAALRAAIDRGQAALIGEQELDHLAAEIPDMRSRLGIRDDVVFGGGGLSMMKMQMSVRESVAKVEEGVKFFARGLRLFGSDIATSVRLVLFAATGGTLKQREVVGLKRTVLDVVTIVPFAIILIAPLTPVGHVLIFGFIQRYFPNLFPSQFTERRQALMSKYDQLRQQLFEAQELASEEEQQRVVAAATQAISRLGEALNPAGLGSAQRVVQALAEDAQASKGGANGSSSVADPQWAGDGAYGGGEEGPAARAVRELELQLAAAEKDALRSVDYSTDNEEHSMSDPVAKQQRQGA